MRRGALGWVQWLQVVAVLGPVLPARVRRDAWTWSWLPCFGDACFAVVMCAVVLWLVSRAGVMCTW